MTNNNYILSQAATTIPRMVRMVRSRSLM